MGAAHGSSSPYARVQLSAAVDPGPGNDYGDLRVRDDRGPAGPIVKLNSAARSPTRFRAAPPPPSERRRRSVLERLPALRVRRLARGIGAAAVDTPR
jgi:hypothetical protein